MSQILEHADNAVKIALAAHTLALVIVNLTKTPKDNEAVAKFYKLLEIVAGIVTPRAKK